MAETNKVVTKHYPVEKLPEELWRGMSGGELVRVTVAPDEPPSAAPRPLHEMRGFAAEQYARHGLDPVEFIRQLRDEWDD